MAQKNRYATAALVVVMIGLAACIYLTSHHYDLLYGLREGKSFCNVNSTMNCDAVNSSSFSELFGVSVALFGGATFFVQLLLLLGFRAFTDEEKPKLARFFFYLTWPSVLFSLYLFGASLLVLKAVCIICFSLYVMIGILFFCGWKISGGFTLKHLKNDLLSSRVILFLILLIPAGSFLIHGMIKSNISANLDTIIQSNIAEWNQNRKIDFFIENAPEEGNPKANMQIVEFSDYQCPHCRRASPTIHAFVSSHLNSVHFIFQNYPLSSECNPALNSVAHDKACVLAKASMCAFKQGKFQQAHDWIFDHQEGLTSSAVDDMSTELGLDKSVFNSCMADPAISSEITKQAQRGTSAGVQGTPTVFVNGRLLPNGYMIPILEQALRQSK